VSPGEVRADRFESAVEIARFLRGLFGTGRIVCEAVGVPQLDAFQMSLANFVEGRTWADFEHLKAVENLGSRDERFLFARRTLNTGAERRRIARKALAAFAAGKSDVVHVAQIRRRPRLLKPIVGERSRSGTGVETY